MIGRPSLHVLDAGWDKQNMRGRASGVERWYPTLRQEREGWGTRSLVGGIEPRALTLLQHAGLFGGAEANQPVDGIGSTMR